MATKKQKEKNSFMVYHTWIDQFNMLSNKEFVNMINNLYRCDKNDKPILNTDKEKLLWKGLGFVVEGNIAKWEARAEASRTNGASGGAPVKVTSGQLNLLNNIENLDKQTGFPNNLDNPVGFHNNLDNMLNVHGQLLKDNGELQKNNCKL